jgi:hypothetical protein
MIVEKRGARDKKAQISIFMIFAALLLLGGILWFTLIEVSEQENDFIPEDIKPIHEFITQCLSDSTALAMQRIGETGGYVDIPMQISTNPSAYLNYAPHIRNPYWWHDGIEAIPTLEFIAGEAQRDAQRRVEGCLDNLSIFIGQYSVQMLSSPRVEIFFGDVDTTSTLHYALALQTSNNATRHEIDQFKTVLPIQFKRIHNLSATILEKANKEFFFEKKALDLMSMAPSEIPITEIDMSCETKRWDVGAVKSKTQQLLAENIPYVKILGTSFSKEQYVPNPFEAGDEQTFENSYFNYHYIWDLGRSDWNNLRVGFEYDRKWPTVFNVRPSDSGVMESNAMEGTRELSMLCMQIAHFTYDVQFPVRISVVDPSSQTRPYVFSFAFENSIDKNYPSREQIAKELFEVPEELSTQEYCAQGEHPTTIYTVINTTSEFVKGINLSFVCGRFTCPIGHSDWISFGAAAGLTKNLPRCTNGIIRGSGEKYTSSEKFITINRDDQVAFLNVFPTKEVPVRVVKHNTFTLGQEELLSSSERAIISITSLDADFKSSTFFTQDNLDVEPPLKLLGEGPHKYKLTIYLVRSETIVGGYESEITLDISKNDAKSAIFHVVESGFASEADNANFLLNLAQYSKNVPQPQVG